MVGQQGLVSDDTAANTDARVITVMVELDARSSAIAARFTNLEVIARIDTRAALTGISPPTLERMPEHVILSDIAIITDGRRRRRWKATQGNAERRGEDRLPWQHFGRGTPQWRGAQPAVS
jgi:hypothetical protein